MKLALIFGIALAFGFDTPARRTSFEPGAVWPDTNGRPIQAHSAGILRYQDTWYWYGEDKTLGNGNKRGVSVYTSRDLYNWMPAGLALPKEAMPEQFRDTGIVERPKVLFNSATKQFVMWMHLDTPDYKFASAGVAVSSSPLGPFRFLKAFRPVQYDAGFAADDWANQKKLDGTYRDMNLFLDDDGKAYAFYASEDNWTMYVVRLNADFTDVERPAVEGKTWARILIGRQREAPAPFKYDGRYYLITSGCTGWKPNAASYAVASNILGPWAEKGNPAAGPESDTTYRSQSTFVLAAPGAPAGSFIFLADRWNEHDLADSRYVWLPFRIQPDGAFHIEWRDKWDISIFRSNIP